MRCFLNLKAAEFSIGYRHLAAAGMVCRLGKKALEKAEKIKVEPVLFIDYVLKFDKY